MGIRIGNGNKIKKTTIAEKIEVITPNKKERFYDKHPWISAILVALITGIILLFSFWETIIKWFERLIERLF